MKGGSIIDLILVGSMNDQSNSLRRKSKKFNDRPISSQMIIEDANYFIEDGKTYYAKRTYSQRKCGFVNLLELSDYTIANTKLFYHDQFYRSRHSNFLSNDENYGYLALSILHDPISQPSVFDQDSNINFKALIRTANVCFCFLSFFT